MCAPWRSKARNEASRPLSRSRFGIPTGLSPSRPGSGTFNMVYNVPVTVCEAIGLRDAEGFRSAYVRHHRGVYAAAFRILGDVQLSQDVVQDVFLRFWRRPNAFDSRRGELGSYLRLMARSRALDLWREGQVRARPPRPGGAKAGSAPAPPTGYGSPTSSAPPRTRRCWPSARRSPTPSAR